MTLYSAWKSSRIEENPSVMGGTPIFKGTRLSVTKIGSMILEHGYKVIVEIHEDYPYLTNDDIVFAPVYTKEFR